MPTEESLLNTISEAKEELRSAIFEAMELSYSVGEIGRAIGLLSEFENQIFERHPGLKPAPPYENEPVPELTEEQLKSISELTPEKVKEIDAALFSYLSYTFQKVAKIVGLFMTKSGLHEKDIPDIFYAQRIEEMANNNQFEHQGDLKHMRFSEVRKSKT